ncbi:putative alpha- and gamma-adaptin-binding protein p34 [Blattamonas nauphoetae]|uniref:Alpha- and gamma-adaptin-binding protein p34 n=1 Tax=Blattamonas nauphoetae TaxID=2049346 RepID=A0ABQ9XHK1_9EUKA|nr:putative alpha- and gamma-adaptin-binding protein p34 [Blattamonas nauphoetae]
MTDNSVFVIGNKGSGRKHLLKALTKLSIISHTTPNLFNITTKYYSAQINLHLCDPTEAISRLPAIKQAQAIFFCFDHSQKTPQFFHDIQPFIKIIRGEADSEVFGLISMSNYHDSEASKQKERDGKAADITPVDFDEWCDELWIEFIDCNLNTPSKQISDTLDSESRLTFEKEGVDRVQELLECVSWPNKTQYTKKTKYEKKMEALHPETAKKYSSTSTPKQTPASNVIETSTKPSSGSAIHVNPPTSTDTLLHTLSTLKSPPHQQTSPSPLVPLPSPGLSVLNPSSASHFLPLAPNTTLIKQQVQACANMNVYNLAAMVSAEISLPHAACPLWSTEGLTANIARIKAHSKRLEGDAKHLFALKISILTDKLMDLDEKKPD